MLYTKQSCRKITCSIGFISGLVLFIVGICKLPERPVTSLEEGKTVDDSNKDYTNLVVHSPGFYITISGASVVVITLIWLIYIVDIQLKEELLELERREVPRRSALRVARVLPVPQVPDHEVYNLTVQPAQKGPVIQVIKKFRYPPPYEAFNRPSAP